MLAPTTDQRVRTQSGRSNRLSLTYLVQLALADPAILDRMLQGDALDAAVAHPHYAIAFDQDDRAALTELCARARSPRELLARIADLADGAAP